MFKIRNIPFVLAAAFLFSVISCSLHAQETTGGFAGSFSRMGFSPRGMAMGNAMTAVTQEGSYSYYNPAFSALKIDGVQVDAGTSSLQFDRRLNFIQSHFQLPPSAGLSVSLLHSRVGSIDGRDLNGYHTGYFSTNEFQLAGNFGIRFSEHLWAGIGLKYNLARYHPEIPASSGLGVDAGILIHPASNIQVGLSVQNLLASYRFNTSDLYDTDRSDNQEFFPIRILTGVSYQIGENLIISIDYENRRHSFETIHRSDAEEQSARRNENDSNSNYLRSGTSYQMHERFTLRGGLQLNNLGYENDLQPGAGFSIHFPYDTFSPSVDYAFVREPSGLSSMHVFSIRLNL